MSSLTHSRFSAERSPSRTGRNSEVARILQNSPTYAMAPAKPVSILWGEFELGTMIGAGSFGHVYDGKHVKTGKVFAVKRFKNKYNSKKKAFE